MMNKIEQFLKVFQKFEKLVIEASGSTDSTRLLDAVRKLSSTNSFIWKNYGLIEDMYALRNVFSHRERGDYIAKINDIAVKELERLIDEIKKPPTVLPRFKGFKGYIYQADVKQTIFEVMGEMQDPKQQYTNVPVWDGSRFIGVFSYTSFFAWLYDEQKKKDKEVTFVKRFIGDINPKYLNSPAVNFEFIPENMNLYEVPSLFEKAVSPRKRLDCLLITKTGKRNYKITGIITPWDLGSI